VLAGLLASLSLAICIAYNSHLCVLRVVKSNSSLPVAYFLHIPATEVE